jgi:CRP-like cAMP-binding protein
MPSFVARADGKSYLHCMELDIPDSLKPYTATVITGTILCKEGEASQDLFILIKGRFLIRKGGRVVSQITNPGDYIGEMSSLLKVPRTATIIADGETEVLRIPADKVLEFFQHSPQLGLKLATILAQRLKTMDENYVKLKDQAISQQKGFVANMESFLQAIESKIAETPNKISPALAKWFLTTFAKVRKQLKIPEFKAPKETLNF